MLGEAAGKAAVVELDPGDILFLPTGWFHQVSSSGGQHMAINYWWRPPDWKQAVDIEARMQTDLARRFAEAVKAQRNSEL
ncbi:jmj4 [Symbiodinium microadriaticum]|nr:jmj4 [Symbiodinium microadriaticum]